MFDFQSHSFEKSMLTKKCSFLFDWGKNSTFQEVIETSAVK